MRLQDKVEKLSDVVSPVGPVERFEAVGRMQLIVLLRNGLYPESNVLDIGCGALRGGYWLINFLNPGCYFGIEPNRRLVDVGIEHILGPDLMRSKQPKFDSNADFDFSVFGQRLDFFLARSVWTHASKPQIERMLDSFCQHSTDDAVFLADFKPAGLLINRDYKGAEWVSSEGRFGLGGLVSHRFGWIRKRCRERGLVADRLKEDCMPGHVWLRIVRRSSADLVRKRSKSLRLSALVWEKIRRAYLGSRKGSAQPEVHQRES